MSKCVCVTDFKGRVQGLSSQSYSTRTAEQRQSHGQCRPRQDWPLQGCCIVRCMDPNVVKA